MLTYGWGDSVAPKTAPGKRQDSSSSSRAKPVDRGQGFFAGTKVACSVGWRKVEKLSVGDKVLTFDNGMKPIVEIRRAVIFEAPSQARPDVWPIRVPEGVLGNREVVVLPADQGVMLETDAVEDPMGDPFAVMPARVLAGLNGITRDAPKTRMEVISLVFADDEVIYMNGGVLAFCPRSQAQAGDTPDAARTVYKVLSLEESALVIKHVDLGAQLPATPGTYVFGATDTGLVA